MWNRRRTWLVLAALSCVALAVYFEPTRCVRGWLWGEAFFEGRPTSYWRSFVARDLQLDVDAILAGGIEPTFCERFTHSLGIRPRSLLTLFTDTQANNVLRELAEDKNTNVAGYALGILDADADDRNKKYGARNAQLWLMLHEKYGRR